MSAAIASLPAELQVFAADAFDSQSYANAVINNEPYQPGAVASSSASAAAAGPSSSSAAPQASGITTTGGDVTAALAKLNFGIEDLNRQIRHEVTSHHPALLNKAASISSLEDALRSVRKGLGEVEGSVARLQKKISEPYEVLDAALGRLERLQRAAELCRRVARFVTLAKRLEGQMASFDREDLDHPPDHLQNGEDGMSKSALAKSISATRQERKERALAEAALTLAELDGVLALDESPQALATSVADPAAAPTATPANKAPSIRDLVAISHHLVAVDAARRRVEEAMETMIGRGLVELDQGLLASSLQTAYNLKVLPSLVGSLVGDLTEAIEGRIKVAFDVAALAREVSHKESSTTSSFVYKSRSRTEPTSVNLPQWTSLLWSRLEALIDDMTGCCVKVYTLEKVLEGKKDAVTGTSFLEEAMRGDELRERPRIAFWTTLGQVFEREARHASGSSSFIQQTLTVSYPRLLRLFHDFFSRISVHTSTLYNAASQSPETILLLRAVGPFEAMYHSRSGNRMAEAVSAAMARCSQPGQGAVEGVNVARALGNELDAARFDPLLFKGIARKVNDAGTTFVSRIDSSLSTDYSSRSMLGPVATPAQLANAEYANALAHFASRLARILVEYPEPTRLAVLPAAESAAARCQTSTAPLATSIRKELSSILARMHRLDFSKVDPSSHGASGYMNELTSKLAYVREEILVRYRLGEEKMQAWILEIARHLLQVFLIHASIVAPLGEAGKLRLTADMAELEFAVSQLGGVAGINPGQMPGLVGDDWRALRGFRQLLFFEKDALTNVTSGPAADVPPLLVLHHIAVRSRAPGEQHALKMPHEASGWTQAEYLRWLEEHPAEKDRLALVEGLLGLRADGPAQGTWADLARVVIAETRERADDE